MSVLRILYRFGFSAVTAGGTSGQLGGSSDDLKENLRCLSGQLWRRDVEDHPHLTLCTGTLPGDLVLLVLHAEDDPGPEQPSPPSGWRTTLRSDAGGEEGSDIDYSCAAPETVAIIGAPISIASLRAVGASTSQLCVGTKTVDLQV